MDIREAKIHLNRHPWEIARFQILWQLLGPRLKEPLASLADIGAGDLYVLEKMQKLLSPNTDLLAVDANFASLEATGRIRKYHHVADLADASLDVALLMDILEHTPDDACFLQEVCTKVRHGGWIFITVPAVPSLYTSHDKRLGHYRRYSKASLMQALAACSLEVEQCSYFFSCLTPIRLWQKLCDQPSTNDRPEIAGWPYAPDSLITRSFVHLLTLDAALNRFLARLGVPAVGLSLGALCQKK